METKFDKYDSILKIIVYGTSFSRYLVSLSSDPRSDAVSERIEQVTDLSYRVRSLLGAFGILLDYRSLASTWKFGKPQSGKLDWKRVVETSIISSGILSNAMDLGAAVIWMIPKLFSFLKLASSGVRACFFFLYRVRSRRGVFGVRADVASAVASEESDSWLDNVRETVEWLANVFWALMSTLSLCSSLYTLYKAIKKSTKPLTSDLEVREAGIEAIESALDLAAGGTGALQMECEASGIVGLAPTLAGCLHLTQLGDEDDDENDDENGDGEVKVEVPAVQPQIQLDDLVKVKETPLTMDSEEIPLSDSHISDSNLVVDNQDDVDDPDNHDVPDHQDNQDMVKPLLPKLESKRKPKDAPFREHKQTVLEI